MKVGKGCRKGGQEMGRLGFDFVEVPDGTHRAGHALAQRLAGLDSAASPHFDLALEDMHLMREVPPGYHPELGSQINHGHLGSLHLEAESLGRSYISWSRVAQWLPWMRMGSKPGLMVINATGFSSWNRDDIPEPLKSVLEERYPIYFVPPPVTDERPNETSWTVFRKYIEAQSSGEH